VNVVEVTEFGEDALRHLSMAPDAFVQVAFQCAWYRLKGAHPASTYESAQTKVGCCVVWCGVVWYGVAHVHERRRSSTMDAPSAFALLHRSPTLLQR
jgi:hypothetical protein